MSITDIEKPGDLKLYTYKGDDFSLLVKWQYGDGSLLDLSSFQEITWNIYDEFAKDPRYSFALTSGELEYDGDGNELLKSSALDSEITEELGSEASTYRHSMTFNIDGTEVTLVSSELTIRNAQSEVRRESDDTVTINETTNEVTVSAELDSALIALNAKDASEQIKSDVETLKESIDQSEENVSGDAEQVSSDKEAVSQLKSDTEQLKNTTSEEADRAESEADRAETAANADSRQSLFTLPATASLGYQDADGDFHRITPIELARWIQEVQDWELGTVEATWDQDSGTTDVIVNTVN